MAEEKKDSREYERETHNILGWFLFGVLVGTGVAILLSPRTGKEAREYLKEKTSEFKKKASETIDRAEEMAYDLLEQGKETFEEKKSMLKAAFEAGREAMREEMEKQKKEESKATPLEKEEEGA